MTKKLCRIFLKNQDTHEPEFDLKKIRDREKEIAEKATKASKNDIDNHYHLLKNHENSIETRLESFLILLTRHRRYKDTEKGIAVWEDFSGEFVGTSEDQKLSSFFSQHVYSILLKDRGTETDLDTAIRLARHCLKLVPDYPGALHSLAGGLVDKAKSNGQSKEEKAKLLNEALKAVNTAIDSEPGYPKYYSTRARVHAQLGLYEKADQDIRHAIDQEDSGSPDYPIRLTNYLEIKSETALSREILDIERQISDATLSAVSEAKSSNIQILTIFIAVISLLIGGISVSASYPFIHAAQLIFALAAALLIFISGFGVLYEPRSRIKRFLFGFAISTILIVISVFLDKLYGIANEINLP
ncbi:tetratricopeptide repeat protein [Marinobacter oulmenensis]|uniref:Tetratricopeptide (TPR) repeat protein n=1 Tax=Marinobacter oulmenensis TaxID=643747 RepID=A0A840U9U2_9GAMM|nr:hypothetical protein [Marinobacter oulmenensis]MBB5321889.1 tetratricopeptide (TPR) repeat protein [Marinobacter oulmenensis]